MNKRTVYLYVGVFGTLGVYLPVLIGVDDGFGGWSVLGGFVGGLLGVWIAVVVAKRFS